MENDNRNSHDELIGKWFNQSLSPDDQEVLNAWASKSDENDSMLSNYEKIKESLDHLNLMESIDGQGALLKVKKRINQTLRFRQIMNIWQKAAAILLLPLITYLIFQHNTPVELSKDDKISWHEISTPVGIRSSFTLPDGTKVDMNDATTIKFPNRFAGTERVIELEGEAFFDVYTNKKVPFVVKCGELNIQATGTAFNVLATKGTQKVVTALIEGIVHILKDSEKEREKLLTMVPGDIVEYHLSTNRLYKANQEINKLLGWRQGELIFKNDPLTDVLARLASWYNVEFEIDGGISADYAYTGSFKDERLEQILKYIELTTPLKFRYIKNKKSKKQLIKVELK